MVLAGPSPDSPSKLSEHRFIFLLREVGALLLKDVSPQEGKGWFHISESPSETCLKPGNYVLVNVTIL
jgi:hypothetical protein